MALINHDQAKIREYLLGHLNDEDEQEKIEERLILEDDLFEEFEVLKGELIEEYYAGELTQKERDWFEHNYLASTEGRERYALTVAIDCLQFQPAATAVHRPTFFEKLAAIWNKPQWVTAVASIVLVAAVGIIWLSNNRPRTPVSVALVNSNLARSGDNNPLPTVVTMPPDASELRASLPLPKSFPNGTRFQALLDDRSDKKPVSVADHKDNTVTVVIPANRLRHGHYALELTAILPDGTEEAIPGSYRFDIN